ncbi:MAG: TlpA disulfide reductase family protein [Planctomycetia bacterium]|nr:TlpA disulfide reductase family protein [Planctomycetia bacterium]
MKIVRLILVLFCLMLSTSVFAQKSLYDCAPKDALWGSQINFNSLKGKVVFVEYWGINCPPCRAAFPKLIECQQKYGGTGKFVLIGSHLQGKSDKVSDFLKKQGCNFTVYQGFSGPDGGPDGGIPSAAIYDHTGKVVEKGHPSSLVSKIPMYLERAANDPLEILGSGFSPCTGLNLGKDFRGLPKYFTPGKSWKNPMKKLESLGKGKGSKEGIPEAAQIHERISKNIENEIEHLLAERSERPIYALLHLTQLNKSLRGLPQEKKVKDALTELRKENGVSALQKLYQEGMLVLKLNSQNLEPKKRDTLKARVAKLYEKLEKFSDSEDYTEALREEARTLMQTLEKEFSLENYKTA